MTAVDLPYRNITKCCGLLGNVESNITVNGRVEIGRVSW